MCDNNDNTRKINKEAADGDVCCTMTKCSTSASRPSSSSYIDTATECAICYEPLSRIITTDSTTMMTNCDDDDGNNDNHEKDLITIQLTCGHKWHLHCIQEQLRLTAQPDYSRRIIFTGCRCAKCSTFCDHPLLQNLTDSMYELKKKVETLIIEQVENDQPQMERYKNGTYASNNIDEWLEYGHRNYAFYLCSSCQEPYFGGKIQCNGDNDDNIRNLDQNMGDDETNHVRTAANAMAADDADAVATDDAATELSTDNPRLCPSCSPSSILSYQQCRSPIEHRLYHVWKCRYCCQPAAYLCYGNVHFCTGCHEKQRGPQKKLHELIPIPCPGGDNCPYPKPTTMNNRLYHENGPAHTCEQVYSCGVCTGSIGQTVSIPLGSFNLLTNPTGQQGLRGWDYRRPFEVERCEIPHTAVTNTIGSNHTTNNSSDNNHDDQYNTYCFVSSFNWSVMRQTICLNDFINFTSLPITGETGTGTILRMEVAAKYMGRDDCPSIFQLQAILHTSRRNHSNEAPIILEEKHTNALLAPVDSWERVNHILELPVSTNIINNASTTNFFITIVIAGKDQRAWRGNYGSKVADCSIRILGTNDELRTILRMNDGTVQPVVARPERRSKREKE